MQRESLGATDWVLECKRGTSAHKEMMTFKTGNNNSLGAIEQTVSQIQSGYSQVSQAVREPEIILP